MRSFALPATAIALALALSACGGKEDAKLEKGQAKVAKKEEKAKADGVVTKKERAKLQHAENKQSRKINRQKHDAQTKPVVPPAN